MPDKTAQLARDLADLEARGLRRRRRVLETPQGPRVTVDGRPYVAFCSNDYLGLAAHPELIAAAQEGARRYGVGAGASHLILGHSISHERLETALARFVGLPAALLFSSGYMANIGVVTALAPRNAAVFCDKFNHASLNDAALLSRADFRRYPHKDLGALERLLRGSTAATKLIVTDAVFSMDGDIAPVPELHALAEQYDAWLVLDDAHGFGVLGARGQGVLGLFDIRSPRIVYMGTLGKAAGVCGAFVAASREVVDTLVQSARTYVYTTAAPALLAEAVAKSLDLIEHDGWRRARISEHGARLKSGLQPCRWRLLPSDTAIQPLLVGPSNDAMALSEQLATHGILVPAIRPPTVPLGSARLRISLSAAHTSEDVSKLVDALVQIDRAPG
ncbi:MAG: 8-amino-7-oxononanoate synthase [Burkholderiales bacterium]